MHHDGIAMFTIGISDSFYMFYDCFIEYISFYPTKNIKILLLFL